MCMFCAAIPTVATLGVVVNSKQRTAAKVAQSEGKPLPRRLATGPLTAGAVTLLVMGSIYYHTHFPV